EVWGGGHRDRPGGGRAPQESSYDDSKPEAARSSRGSCLCEFGRLDGNQSCFRSPGGQSRRSPGNKEKGFCGSQENPKPSGQNSSSVLAALRRAPGISRAREGARKRAWRTAVAAALPPESAEGGRKNCRRVLRRVSLSALA